MLEIWGFASEITLNETSPEENNRKKKENATKNFKAPNLLLIGQPFQ